MVKFFLLMLSIFIGSHANADTKITKDAIYRMNDELNQASKNRDISAIDKYMGTETLFLTDSSSRDTSTSNALNFDKYREMSLDVYSTLESYDAIDKYLKLEINPKTNVADVEMKSIVIMTSAGIRAESTSITYAKVGVIAGKIKILSIKEVVISSNAERLK